MVNSSLMVIQSTFMTTIRSHLRYITSKVDTVPINMQQPDLLCLKALCYVETHFKTIN